MPKKFKTKVEVTDLGTEWDETKHKRRGLRACKLIALDRRELIELRRTTRLTQSVQFHPDI
jgi:hypothetical protein